MEAGSHLKAFSLVEITIVVAVIGVLTSLVIITISGTAEHANQAVARQQQAELQAALGNWIVAASSQSGGLAGAKHTYTNTPNKLSLLSNYLQESTFLRLTSNATEVSSAALSASKARLHFSTTWDSSSSPTVTWSNVQ